MEHIPPTAHEIAADADGADEPEDRPRVYGVSRKRRRTFAYPQLEAAALEQLAAGVRPTVGSGMADDSKPERPAFVRPIVSK